VAWNWGDDEPVPAVTVADVGSRQEVTAEALNTLLASGALSAEPGLESWVRRNWRLPDYYRPEPQPAPPPVQDEQPDDDQEPPTDKADQETKDDDSDKAKLAPKKQARRRKPKTRGQLALPIAAAAPGRELTPDELASGVDFAAIAAEQDQAAQDLAEQWQAETAAPVIDAVVAGVVAGLAAGGVAGLADVAVSSVAVAALAGMLSGAMVEVAAQVGGRVEGELGGLGFDFSVPALDRGVVDGRAAVTAKLVVSGMTNGATKTALLNGTDPKVVEAAVRAELEKLATAEPSWVVGSMESALAAVAGEARMAAYEALIAARGESGIVFIASEINDAVRCAPCSKIDGVRFGNYAEAKAAYPAGQYMACLGRERCRGLLIATIPD
jgi:hypothetical protein